MISRIVDASTARAEKHGCECGTNHAEVSDEQATLKFADQLLAIYIQLLDDLIIINNYSKE